MGLREIESALPPGFRFCPSDEELVCHYLYNKVNGILIPYLLDVDLHVQEPWDLPDGAKLSANEWYFFSFRDRKYATGSRSNRATRSGYWKATGKDRTVREPSVQAVVGMRKTLVFYRGRSPNGIRTSWVMHEFRIEDPFTPAKEDWVLCRVLNKSKVDAFGSNISEHQQINSMHSHLMLDSPRQRFLGPVEDRIINDGEGVYRFLLNDDSSRESRGDIDAAAAFFSWWETEIDRSQIC